MNRCFLIPSLLFCAGLASALAACGDEAVPTPQAPVVGGSAPMLVAGGHATFVGLGGSAAVSGGSAGSSMISAGSDGAVAGGSAAGGAGLCDAPDVGGPSITWAPGPDLPTPRDHHETWIVESCAQPYLYVGGGFKQATGGLLTDISRAPIAKDGSLGAWESVGALPKPAAGAGVALQGGHVVLAAGYGSFGSMIGKINDDGSLGTFTNGPNFPFVLFHNSAAAIDGAVYVSGGINGTMTEDAVYRGTIAADGTIAAWNPIAKLPYTLSHHTSVGYHHRLYILGGQTGNVNISAGTSHQEVYSALVQADGTLGAWQQLTSLPVAPSTHASIAHDGFLYVIAGIDDPSLKEQSDVISNQVLRAPINADGTIGDWVTDTASNLPHAKSHMHQTPAFNGHIYSVAGLDQIEPMVDTAEVDVGTFGN